MSETLSDKLKKMHRFRNVRGDELRRVARITQRLGSTNLFKSLDLEDLARIAQSGDIVRYERGQEIIREGDTDRVFYVILTGQVRAWIEQDGKRRLLNYHESGDFFGELIFMKNNPRAATIDVVEDVELVRFDQKGWERIVQYSQIQDYLQTWGQQRIQISNQPFRGKHWDEISVVLAHKSWVALVQLIMVPILVILLLWGVWGLLTYFGVIPLEITLSILIASTIGMGLWIFWMYEDWRNDEFIVTSKRLIHIERVLVPPFPVERHEAPIDQVQDITTRNHGLWTPLFKVNALEIETAGAGTIRFPYLEKAQEIREKIFHARDVARTRRNVEERSNIRHSLRSEIGLEDTELSPIISGDIIEPTPDARGLLKLINYFIPRTRLVEPHQITWRKHWLIYLKEVSVSALLFFLSLITLSVAIIHFTLVRGIPIYFTMPVPLLALLGSFGWYVWQYDGWRNDVYIVTDTRIIDIEGSPFHLREEHRREGAFDIIQNIDYKSPNWFARIFRVGQVTISTAAKQDAFTFDYVPRPEEVQQEIFKRLTKFRENKEHAENERRNAEYTKWFGIYDRLRQNGEE